MPEAPMVAPHREAKNGKGRPEEPVGFENGAAR
jgi:hypothetical protein